MSDITNNIKLIEFLSIQPTILIRALCKSGIITEDLKDYFPNIPKYCFLFEKKTIVDDNRLIHIPCYDKSILNFQEKLSELEIPIFKGNNSKIFILKEDLEKFIDGFHLEKSIYWESLYKDKTIVWNHDLILKYKHILFWPAIQIHSNLKWSFKLLEQVKDYCNWILVCDTTLYWDIKMIDKFQDYIIFSKGKNNKLKKNCDSVRGYEYFVSTKSLSKSSFVDWSSEILMRFEEFWDWKELSSNTSINWNEELMDKFIDKVDFKELSANKNIYWTQDMILKYSQFIDWENISGNPNVNWSEELLTKFENNWYWKPKYDLFLGDRVHAYSCLSNNKGILWTISMCNRWESKIDFWRIAFNGMISFDVIEIFHDYFDRVETIGSVTHKWSDFRETEYLYSTGWENLDKNSNFRLNEKNIDFLYKRKLEITYSDGNLAKNGKYITSNYSVLEILRDKRIEGITNKLLVQNLNTWAQILINEKFINHSILENNLIPMLSNTKSLFHFLKITNDYFDKLNSKKLE